jgi:hypothetical protein
MSMPGRDEQFAQMATELGAQQRRESERAGMMQRALEDAMHAPHEIRDLHVHATGVAEIGPMQRAIIVALPTGEQLRVHLNPQNARGLAEALAKPFEGESEGGSSSALELPGS